VARACERGACVESEDCFKLPPPSTHTHTHLVGVVRKRAQPGCGGDWTRSTQRGPAHSGPRLVACSPPPHTHTTRAALLVVVHRRVAAATPSRPFMRHGPQRPAAVCAEAATPRPWRETAESPEALRVAASAASSSDRRGGPEAGPPRSVRCGEGGEGARLGSCDQPCRDSARHITRVDARVARASRSSDELQRLPCAQCSKDGHGVRLKSQRRCYWPKTCKGQ